MLTSSEKIKIILNRKHLTAGSLADKMGKSRQNLSNKMVRDNFQEKELREIADILGCDLSIDFIDRATGERI